MMANPVESQSPFHGNAMSKNEDVLTQPLLATAFTANRQVLPVASVAVVDSNSFIRDCIALSIGKLGRHLSCNEKIDIEKFASCDELSSSEARFATIVYHFHGLPDEDLSKLRKLTETAATVIVLSQDESTGTIRAAFECGARGYIPTRDAGLDLLIAVLSFVNAGGTFVPSSVLARTELPKKYSHGLTEREMLILNLLKKGKQNKLIAYELGLSESAVKVHVRKILSKLHVNNRTEAVSAAMIPDRNDEHLNVEHHPLMQQLNSEKPVLAERVLRGSVMCNKDALVPVSDYQNRQQAARSKNLAETTTTPALKARLLKVAAD
jgi:DNA-binding NarL/FixJ family response regulator